MPPIQKTARRLFSSTLAVILASTCLPAVARAEDGYDLWLRYAPIESAPLRDAYRQAIAGVVVQQSPETGAIVTRELGRALKSLLGVEVPAWTSVSGDGALVVGTASSPIVSALGWGDVLKGLGPEGFVIRATRIAGKRAIVVASEGDRGALYGTFHLLRLLSTATPLSRLDVREKPRFQVRLLDHWDNLDGSIERGYAGRSLWKWDELPGTIDPRLHDYARANASIGLNGSVINNVNANPKSLTADYIAKAAAIADVFRPYGIRVYLSANFAAPRMTGGLASADPADPAVQQWWKAKADEIYRAIPDFGGFLVKANSEGQPGPQDYRRTHADGANVLADAVRPHGGIVMWRAFVYDATVDPDRVKRAYKEFVPLDGTFRDNVFLQVKNGPLDFMPREPVHPLYGAIPKTPAMVELQITQEYLGQSTHLVYLAPMWKEFFDTDTLVAGPGSTVARIADGTLQRQPRTGIAGVANTGSDRNWTGHPFAAANWYAFGRLAWNPATTAEAIAREWIRQTWSRTPATEQAIAGLMLGSREAFVNYTMPLGLHHLIGGDHYAVMPENDDPRRLDWSATYYHRADTQGVGFDRTRAGSGAVDQYAKAVADRLNDPKTTPESLLLFFHHLPWDYRLASGQTLWQGIVAHYQQGAAQAAQMEQDWAALKGSVDDERHAAVAVKLHQQALDAAAWRDKCLTYFARFSHQPIAAAAPQAPPDVRIERNVVYGMVSGLGLLLDVYRPARPNGVALIAIQGTGWYQPMRYDAPPLKERNEVAQHAQRFAEAGYTVFSINHRSAPRFHYPDPIEDAQRAVRFVRAHAADYGVGAARIGAWGSSSGGHLAELLGTLDGAGSPADPDPVNRLSAKVQAVVALFAPSDLPTMFPSTERQGTVSALMGFAYQDPAQGGGARPDDFENQRYREASPVTHVTADDAPMLLFHGDKDVIVPIQQSELLEETLRQAGVEVQFVRVPGGGHGGNFQFPNGDPRAPDDKADAVRWFDTHLQPAAPR